MLASVLLAAWLGAALLFSAAVAPAAFAVLSDRALAGLVVGRVLPVIFLAGIGCGLLSATLDARSHAGAFRRPRVAGGLVLAVCCAIAQLAVAPRIARLRETIGPSLDALAAADPQRVAFGRLHAISVAWLGLAMLAAGAVVVLGLLAARRPVTVA